MKKIILVLSIVLGALMLSFVSATINFNKLSLSKDYSPGELIKGQFSLTFDNESNQNFTSNFGGNIELLRLLNVSGFIQGTDFSCNPSDCRYNYVARYGEESKNIELNNNEKVYGFLISGGSGIEIRNFTFHISSDINSSCLNQVSLDLFDDDSGDFYNTEYHEEDCTGRSYGCFKSDLINNEARIQHKPYCQKITLPAAPAYRVGARIKNSSINGNLSMEIYPLESPSDLMGKCNLPKLTEQTQDRDCVINASSKKQFEALVCVSVDNDATDYKIALSGGSEKCGTWGNEDLEFTSNYEIYSNALKYGKIDKIFDYRFYSKMFPDDDVGLNGAVQNYIDERYANDCEDGCVIPLVISGPAQTVLINNVKIDYNSDSAGGLRTTKIYELRNGGNLTLKSLKTLTFDFEDLGINAPYSNGTRKFYLYYGLDNMTSDSILVSSSTSFSFDLSPKFSLIGQPTMFKVKLANQTIKAVNWEFGDGKTGTSSSLQISHTYLDAGNYDLKVRVEKNDGKTSTKTFRINVGNPSESLRQLIAIDEIRMANITQQKADLPLWIRDEIEKKINFTKTSLTLSEIKRDYEVADKNDSEEISNLLEQLIALNIPYAIKQSEKGSNIPIELSFQNMDLSYIKQISAQQEENDDALKDKIVSWYDSNFDVKVDYEVYSGFYDDGDRPILTRYTIKVNPLASSSAYLIIDYPFDSIKFKQVGNERAIGSGAYISIQSQENIELILSDKVEIKDLGIYVSPDISKLEKTIFQNLRSEGFNWTKFSVGLIAVLILAGVAFYFGRIWYIKNYESHLFKNPRDLFNIMGFIINAKNSGLNDKDIKKKLVSVGWTSEQITYAMGKIKKGNMRNDLNRVNVS